MRALNQATQWVESKVDLGKQTSGLTPRTEDADRWQDQRILCEWGTIFELMWAVWINLEIDGCHCCDSWPLRVHKGSSDFPGKQKLALWSQGNTEFSFLFTYSGDIDSSTAILRAYFGPNNYETFLLFWWSLCCGGFLVLASRQLRHPAVSSWGPGPVCLKLRKTL